MKYCIIPKKILLHVMVLLIVVAQTSYSSTLTSYAKGVMVAENENTNEESYIKYVSEYFQVAAENSNNENKLVYTNNFLKTSEVKKFNQFLMSYFLGDVPTLLLLYGDDDNARIVISTEGLNESINQHNSTLDFLSEVVKQTENYDKERRIIYFSEYLNTYANYDYTYQNKTAYDLMKNHMGICNSYATAFNWMCKLAGYNSRYVVGELNGISHAWNKVNIEKTEWKNIDVANLHICNPYLDDESLKIYHAYQEY